MANAASGRQTCHNAWHLLLTACVGVQFPLIARYFQFDSFFLWFWNPKLMVEKD